jgi:hypothetical protein
LCYQALGPIQLGLPFALGEYLLKYSQLGFEAASAHLPEPGALETCAEIEVGTCSRGAYAACGCGASSGRPRRCVVSIARRSWQTGRRSGPRALVRDGADEDVDLGGVLAGAAGLHGGPQSEVRSDGSTSSACAILRMVEKRGSTSSFSILESCF